MTATNRYALTSLGCGRWGALDLIRMDDVALLSTSLFKAAQWCQAHNAAWLAWKGR